MPERKPKKHRVQRKKAAAIDVAPDAWERFEAAVGKIAPPKTPKTKEKSDER